MALTEEDNKKIIEASEEVVEEVSKPEEIVESSPLSNARTAYQEMLAKQRGELDEKRVKDKDSIKRQRQNQLLGDAVNSLLGSTVGAKGGVIGEVPKVDDTPWNRLAQKEDAYDNAYDSQLAKYNAARLAGTYDTVQHEERMAELMDRLKNQKSEREASQAYTTGRDKIKADIATSEAQKNRDQRTKEQEYVSPYDQARIDQLNASIKSQKAKSAAELLKLTTENEEDQSVSFNGELSFKVPTEIYGKVADEASRLATEIIGAEGFTSLVEQYIAQGMDEDEARSAAKNQNLDNLIISLRDSGVDQDEIMRMMVDGDVDAIRNRFNSIPVDDRSGLRKLWQNVWGVDNGAARESGSEQSAASAPVKDDEAIDDILDSGVIDPNINDQDDGLL